MQTVGYAFRFLAKAIVPVALVFSLQAPVFAADGDQDVLADLKANQAKVVEAEVAKDAAVKARDALLAQQASKPSPDTERKLKDAEYEVMMADRKLSSASKAVERAQKKLDESQGDIKTAPPVVKTEKPAPIPAVVSEDVVKKAAEEQARKEADAKAAAQKSADERLRKEAEAKIAAQKVAEEQARKEAEAKLAAQKASEDAARKAAEAEARKKALAAELGIDKNCIALPVAATNPSATLSESEQAYAQGFLKQINQLVSKKPADDVPPISPAPVLEGSKLNPCDPGQKQALKFGYMGNGQYRVETPVLAGEQTFTVKNIVLPLNRIIPESDNGEVYVFFLDGREGRTKLSAYKKSLLEQPTP
jgi:hypothetical protein